MSIAICLHNIVGGLEKVLLSKGIIPMQIFSITQLEIEIRQNPFSQKFKTKTLWIRKFPLR